MVKDNCKQRDIDIHQATEMTQHRSAWRSLMKLSMCAFACEQGTRQIRVVAASLYLHGYVHSGFLCWISLSLQGCGFLCCQIWCEQTDPQKFVYEDINIAAYLLVRH